MYKCRKCGEQVLKSAKVCRHCGVKNPVPTKLDYVAGAIVLVVILVAVGFGVKVVIDSNAKKKAAEEAFCKTDAECWGKKHLIAATVKCKEEIERLPKYLHEWTDSLTEPKFSRFLWLMTGKSHMTYMGDKIRLQNAFNAWQPHIYECDFDTETKTVLNVRLRPGKL